MRISGFSRFSILLQALLFNKSHWLALSEESLSPMPHESVCGLHSNVGAGTFIWVGSAAAYEEISRSLGLR